MPHTPFRDDKLLGLLINIQKLPVAIRNIPKLLEFICAQEPAWLIPVSFLNQFDEARTVSVFFYIIQKILILLFMMKFLENHMRNGHPKSAVTSGMQRDPLIRVFTKLAKIRRKNNRFGSVVPRFREKMAVGRARHIQVRAHIGNHLGVIPVSTFTDVRLLSPDFRKSIRQITIPIIETQVYSAKELQKPRSRRITHHGHCRDRRKPDDPVGSIFLGRIKIRNRHDFKNLIPRGAFKTALAAGLLIPRPFSLIFLDVCPSLERIMSLFLFFPVHF